MIKEQIKSRPLIYTRRTATAPEIANTPIYKEIGNGGVGHMRFQHKPAKGGEHCEPEMVRTKNSSRRRSRTEIGSGARSGHRTTKKWTELKHFVHCGTRNERLWEDPWTPKECGTRSGRGLSWNIRHACRVAYEGRVFIAQTEGKGYVLKGDNATSSNRIICKNGS
eukprot:6214168-Pleurochrysis_carterae.AAC.2